MGNKLHSPEMCIAKKLKQSLSMLLTELFIFGREICCIQFLQECAVDRSEKLHFRITMFRSTLFILWPWGERTGQELCSCKLTGGNKLRTFSSAAKPTWPRYRKWALKSPSHFWTTMFFHGLCPLCNCNAEFRFQDFLWKLFFKNNWLSQIVTQSNLTSQCCTFTFLLTEPFKIKGNITFATNEVVYLPNFLVDLNWEKNRPCIAEHIISISKAELLKSQVMHCVTINCVAYLKCLHAEHVNHSKRPVKWTDHIRNKDVLDFKSDIIFQRRQWGVFNWSLIWD